MELQGKKCCCFPHVIKLIRVQGCLPGTGCKHQPAAALAQICLQPVSLCLQETSCCCMGLVNLTATPTPMLRPHPAGQGELGAPHRTAGALGSQGRTADLHKDPDRCLLSYLFTT